MALLLTSSLDLMPDSSERIPFFSVFLGMTILTMALLATCLCYTLSIHYANSRTVPLPDWMRKYILERLTPYMGLEVKRKTPNWKQKLRAVELEYQYIKYQINTQLMKEHPGRLWYRNREEEQSATENEYIPQCGDLSTIFCPKAIEQINEKMSVIIEKIADRDQDDFTQSEWHTVARTLDKLSFYVFGALFAMIFFVCVTKLCMFF